MIAVLKTTQRGVKRARNGEGPTLIEAKTYRWMGHYIGDPASYRPEKEAEEWKKKCPIKRFKEKLLKEELLQENELEKIEKEVKERIEEAVAFARKSPLPKLEEALEDVYANQESDEVNLCES